MSKTEQQWKIEQQLRSAEAARRRAGSLHSDTTGRIIGAAIAVHREIGPGKLESVYQHALEIELRARVVPVRAQVPIPMRYRGEPVGDFVVDLIVEERVLVELKAVESLRPVHHAQVLSYLRATEIEIGLLINFNVRVLKDGVRRLIQSHGE